MKKHISGRLSQTPIILSASAPNDHTLTNEHLCTMDPCPPLCDIFHPRHWAFCFCPLGLDYSSENWLSIVYWVLIGCFALLTCYS